jgi:hypothetical protein
MSGSDLAKTEAAIPQPAPAAGRKKKTSKKDSLTVVLQGTGLTAVQEAAHAAGQIVGQASSAIATIYGAIPEAIDAEVEVKLQRKAGAINGETVRRQSELDSAVKAATEQSAAQVTNFLQKYGID